MNEKIKINWYRCKVDKAEMSKLTQTSDFRGLCQVIPQLALFFATCALCWFLFHKMGWSNWHWMLPVLLLALFIHG
ncbi:MAG: hypothetical protein ABI443_11650, partial [Chthoniobacterales bacterium]